MHIESLYCLMSLGLMVIAVWFGWAMMILAAHADERTRRAMEEENDD